MSRQDEALEDLGRYIRAQRELARLSVRHLARMSKVSDSYLSQVERGLYQPSAEVLSSISQALGIAPQELYRRMGWLPAESGEPTSVVAAIGSDERLTPAQKSALVQMYGTMVDGA